MNVLRRQQRLVAVFLSACAVVGILGSLTPRREIFPLYSWFLFSLVPNRTVAFDLLLHAAGERTFEPPISYRQADGMVFRSPHSIRTYRMVQELGRAVETGEDATAARLRRVIEDRFNAWPTRYDLVKVTSDNPLEQWKTGRPRRSERLLALVCESRPAATPP